jgi:small-conductance mechanosensitive channel
MELLNNPPAAWGNAAIAFGATVAALYGARGFLVHKAQRFAAKTANRIDDVAGAMLASTHLLAIVLLAAYAGSLLLALTDRQALFTRRAMICVVLVQAALWADVGVRTWRRDTAGPGADATSTSVVCVVLRTAIWTVALLMMLDNLGFNISTLVASLGVGGIAVALAVQNILGDLFASLSITFDKPFVVGDFIIVDNELGEVEFIGLKTTRIRALGGEQIVFSNADLLKSRIHNHKRMLSRRAAFVVRVAYGVDEDRLAALPAMVREIVEAPGQHPLRARAFLRVRRMVAGLRGGVSRGQSRLPDVHGHPAGDLPGFICALPARGHPLRPSAARAAPGRGRHGRTAAPGRRGRAADASLRPGSGRLARFGGEDDRLVILQHRLRQRQAGGQVQVQLASRARGAERRVERGFVEREAGRMPLGATVRAGPFDMRLDVLEARRAEQRRQLATDRQAGQPAALHFTLRCFQQRGGGRQIAGEAVEIDRHDGAARFQDAQEFAQHGPAAVGVQRLQREAADDLVDAVVVELQPAQVAGAEGDIGQAPAGPGLGDAHGGTVDADHDIGRKTLRQMARDIAGAAARIEDHAIGSGMKTVQLVLEFGDVLVLGGGRDVGSCGCGEQGGHGYLCRAPAQGPAVDFR